MHEDKNTLMKLVIGICAFLSLIIITPYCIYSLDYTIQLNTLYKLCFGDDTMDQDFLQDHWLMVNFTDSFSLHYNGSYRSDIDGMTDSEDTDASDSAFLDVNDAYGGEPGMAYDLYSAFIQYKTDTIALNLGRLQVISRQLTQFDGVSLGFKPIEWFAFTGYGGKPWQDAVIMDAVSNWSNEEYLGGGKVDLSFTDIGLFFTGNYLFLQEEVPVSAAIETDPEYTVEQNQLYDISGKYMITRDIQTKCGISFLNTDVKDCSISLYGFVENMALDFLVNGFFQFLDIDDAGNRTNQFALIMSSYKPYLLGSVEVNKSLWNLFDSSSPVKDIGFGLGYTYRQPFDLDDVSYFNMHYNSFQVISYLKFRKNLDLQIYYEGVIPLDDANYLHGIGGEVNLEIDTFSFELGSIFSINKFENVYGTTQVEESFNAQDYYLNCNWRPIKNLLIYLDSSIEFADMTSLTDPSLVNTDYIYEDLTELNDEPRMYFKFVLGLNYFF